MEFQRTIKNNLNQRKETNLCIIPNYQKKSIVTTQNRCLTSRQSPIKLRDMDLLEREHLDRKLKIILQKYKNSSVLQAKNTPANILYRQKQRKGISNQKGNKNNKDTTQGFPDYFKKERTTSNPSYSPNNIINIINHVHQDPNEPNKTIDLKMNINKFNIKCYVSSEDKIEKMLHELNSNKENNSFIKAKSIRSRNRALFPNCNRNNISSGQKSVFFDRNNLIKKTRSLNCMLTNEEEDSDYGIMTNRDELTYSKQQCKLNKKTINMDSFTKKQNKIFLINDNQNQSYCSSITDSNVINESRNHNTSVGEIKTEINSSFFNTRGISNIYDENMKKGNLKDKRIFKQRTFFKTRLYSKKITNINQYVMRYEKGSKKRTLKKKHENQGISLYSNDKIKIHKQTTFSRQMSKESNRIDENDIFPQINSNSDNNRNRNVINIINQTIDHKVIKGELFKRGLTYVSKGKKVRRNNSNGRPKSTLSKKLILSYNNNELSTSNHQEQFENLLKLETNQRIKMEQDIIYSQSIQENFSSKIAKLCSEETNPATSHKATNQTTFLSNSKRDSIDHLHEHNISFKEATMFIAENPQNLYNLRKKGTFNTLKLSNYPTRLFPPIVKKSSETVVTQLKKKKVIKPPRSLFTFTQRKTPKRKSLFRFANNKRESQHQNTLPNNSLTNKNILLNTDEGGDENDSDNSIIQLLSESPKNFFQNHFKTNYNNPSSEHEDNKDPNLKLQFQRNDTLLDIPVIQYRALSQINHLSFIKHKEDLNKKKNWDDPGSDSSIGQFESKRMVCKAIENILNNNKMDQKLNASISYDDIDLNSSKGISSLKLYKFQEELIEKDLHKIETNNDKAKEDFIVKSYENLQKFLFDSNKNKIKRDFLFEMAIKHEKYEENYIDVMLRSRKFQRTITKINTSYYIGKEMILENYFNAKEYILNFVFKNNLKKTTTKSNQNPKIDNYFISLEIMSKTKAEIGNLMFINKLCLKDLHCYLEDIEYYQNLTIQKSSRKRKRLSTEFCSFKRVRNSFKMPIDDNKNPNRASFNNVSTRTKKIILKDFSIMKHISFQRKKERTAFPRRKEANGKITDVLYPELFSSQNKDITTIRTNDIKHSYINSLGNNTHQKIIFYIKDLNFNKLNDIIQKENLNINLNYQDICGNTFLIFAVQSNSYQMCEYLLEKGCNPNISNNEQLTPLHYALNMKNFNISNLLLLNGANEHAVSLNGLSPWQCLGNQL